VKTRASAKYSSWNKHKSQNQKDQEQIYTFNLVLGLVLWISRTFNSSHFQKEFRADLVQNKVQFHLYYT